ncbi:MAG: nascent polypeptide-associated complex protein [Candidatus Woesearchaeota archaeon]
MFPGVNPRQMRQAMKKLGIKQEEIAAAQVIIRTQEHDIVLINPDVQKVNMGGQWTYQISGEEEIVSRDSTPDISEEDIQTIVEQTSCTKEEAKKALEESKGDLAQAIISLQE